MRLKKINHNALLEVNHDGPSLLITEAPGGFEL
jgi:hypothetical protein